MKIQVLCVGLLLASACTPPVEQSNDTDVDTVASPKLQDTFIEVIEAENESTKAPEPEGMHSDTVQFLSYNGDYDYEYVVLATQTGDTFSIVCWDCIDEAEAGKWFIVNWEMDTLYEAGEGDEPYQKEVLRSYQKLNN